MARTYRKSALEGEDDRPYSVRKQIPRFRRDVRPRDETLRLARETAAFESTPHPLYFDEERLP
jgi:hypothetical protein